MRRRYLYFLSFVLAYVQGLETCTLCEQGRLPENADRDVGPLVPEATALLGTSSISCSLLDELAKDFLKPQDSHCVSLHETVGLKEECGCPEAHDDSNSTQSPAEESQAEDEPMVSNDNRVCSMCADGLESIPDPDYVVLGFDAIGMPAGLTCGQLQMASRFVSPDSGECRGLEDYMSFYCGCADQLVYLKANSRMKQVLLAWLPRIASLLSFLGSFYIAQDVLKSRHQGLSVYQELLLGICTFDLISSTGYIFSTLPIPEVDSYGQPTGVYGAMGSDATCTAQGFFIVLGYTGKFDCVPEESRSLV